MAPARRTSTTRPRGTSEVPGDEARGARAQTCLTCHNRGTHAGWEGSTHEARNLSCTTCHSVHKPASFEQQLVKATETQLCATCHRAQVVKTERAVAHMPVREGKMSCSSCHNPHGSISNVKALKVGNSVNESCMSCHAEMRGPVLWEHAPVRENCATCHDPHGSSNDRMLVVRMPMLCQRCHVATRHPGDDLRQQRHHREQEQPDVRPVVRELPLEHSRLEPSVGPVLHAVAEAAHAHAHCTRLAFVIGWHVSRWAQCRRCAQRQPRQRRRATPPADAGARAPSRCPRAACSRRPWSAGADLGGRWSSVDGRPGAVSALRGPRATACSSPTRATRARQTTGCSGSAPTTSAGAISASSAPTSGPDGSSSRACGTRFRSSTASIPERRTRQRPARARSSSTTPTQLAIQNGQADRNRVRAASPLSSTFASGETSATSLATVRRRPTSST